MTFSSWHIFWAYYRDIPEEFSHICAEILGFQKMPPNRFSGGHSAVLTLNAILGQQLPGFPAEFRHKLLSSMVTSEAFAEVSALYDNDAVDDLPTFHVMVFDHQYACFEGWQHVLDLNTGELQEGPPFPPIMSISVDLTALLLRFGTENEEADASLQEQQQEELVGVGPDLRDDSTGNSS